MKKSKKEAKFYCESCGSEVPRKAKTCPRCGKFFASVRCPQCGKTGTNEDFVNGCPSCGYAINPNSLNNSYGFFGIFKKKSTNKYNKKYAQSYDASLFTKHKKSGYADSSLPVWMYVASIVVLLILVFCLYSCL